MEILKAHRQWSTRPADERFFDLSEMLVTAKEVKAQAREMPAVMADLRVEAQDDDLVLVGKQDRKAVVSNHAFGQLSTRVGAPAAYLRELPPTLAAQNLNHGLKSLSATGDATDAKLLLNVNGALVLRAATTAKYSRVFDADIIEQVLHTLPSNWKTPRAWPANVPGERTRKAGPDDVMSGSIIKAGDTIAPAGCYLSDRDMFMFLIDTESEIKTGTSMVLHRGLMLWNSEVGNRALGGMFFLHSYTCGNHRVWGAEDVFEFSHRHVGNVAAVAGRSFQTAVKKYAESSVSDEEAHIEAEQRCVLGANKEEVVGAILAFAKKKKIDRITNKLLDAAYDAAVEHQDWYGNPHSLYGMTNGITEVGQSLTAHIDERHAIDIAAGKLLDMASTF